MELENLVWSDIAGFLRKPGEVLEKLRAELLARGAEPHQARSELDRLDALVSGHEVERATLYRLFRRGTITQADLETQIAEISAEHSALDAERERLKRQWECAQNSQNDLESAGELMERLRLKLDASSDEELSWEVKRRVVEELVAGIEVESIFDPAAPRGQQRTARVHVTYRFESPDAQRAARGNRNNGTVAASRDAMGEASASGLSLTNTHQMHSSPSAATDRATLPPAN